MFNSKNIFIALTYRCNAFCNKCMTRYHKNKDVEISHEILNRFFTLLTDNDYSGIVSVGTGEPLLFKDLESFVENILKVNDKVRLRMLTNGMLLSVDNNPLIFNERCKWGVTMDAFSQETLMGLQKGVDIEKVKYNVASVAQKYGGSSLYLNFTVSQKNIDQILPFCEFAVNNGITDVYLTELKLFTGYENELSKYKVIHDEYFKGVISEAKKFLETNGISTKGINFERRCNRSDCYLKNRASPVIDVDGSVSFCSGREDIYVGNVMDVDVEKKWLDFSKKVENTQGKWCELCYDRMLPNGIYRLPKTILKEW